MVSKIEQGRCATFDRAVLCQLAQALNLTTLERGEFFAAASELNPAAVACQTADREQNFKHVWQTLSAV